MPFPHSKATLKTALESAVAANKLVLDANKLVLDKIQKEKAENADTFNFFSKSFKVGWASWRGRREWIYVTRVGKMMHCSFHLEGISNSENHATFTIPYAAANFGDVDFSSKNAYTYTRVWSDNESGLIRVASGSKTVKVYRGMWGEHGQWQGSNKWTTGDTKIIAGSFSLPLA